MALTTAEAVRAMIEAQVGQGPGTISSVTQANRAIFEATAGKSGGYELSEDQSRIVEIAENVPAEVLAQIQAQNGVTAVSTLLTTNGVVAQPAAGSTVVATPTDLSTLVAAGEVVATGVGFLDWLQGLLGMGPSVPEVVEDIPISGPGVPEPPQQLISKHWHVKVESQKYGTFQMFYWKLTDGRMMSYHSPTKTFKVWRPKKHIVISTNPRVKMLTKLNKLNARVEKMLRPYAKVKTKYVGATTKTLSPLEKQVLAAAGK